MKCHRTSLRIFSLIALVFLLLSAAILVTLSVLPLLRTVPVFRSVGLPAVFTAAEETETVKTLNAMTEEDFQAANGIGPVLSEKIISFREELGGFRFAEDLQGVNGVGDSKYQAVMELIATRGQTP